MGTFRDYENPARSTVKEFYRLNHRHQTLDFVRKKKKEYHSFYAAHRENAYDYLMNDRDRELMEWVRRFNPFDLYSKGHTPPDREALEPYYRELVEEFFPEPLRW